MASVGSKLSEYSSAAQLSALLESDKFGIYAADSYLALDGVTDDYTALYNLINTTINGDDAEIWFKNGTCLIGTSITIPSNIRLVFMNGGKLQPQSGVAITGSNAKIDSGLTQIFDLSVSGTVAGAWDIKEVYPEWFGSTGDGTTDDTTAFNNALTLHDILFLSNDKTYLIGDVDLNSKSIIGFGTIKKTTASESSIHIKGDGSTVSGVTFDAIATSGQPKSDIKLGDGASNIRISNCTFVSDIYSAISGSVDTTVSGSVYSVAVDGVIITDNIFKNHARPIYLHSINNITISNNIIRDCDFDAIRLRENDGFCIIDGNQFLNIGDPAWSDSQTRDAIDVYWSGDTLTITNNIVKVTAFAGFDIKGSSPDATNKTKKVIISNNQIYKTRYTGIFIRGQLDYDGAGNNSYIESVIVSDNIITECNQQQDTTDGYGIRIEDVAKYINIHDNIISQCYGRGIMVNQSISTDIVRSIKITGNFCVNNGLSTNQASSEGGIYVAAVDGAIICNNICENDTTIGNPYQSTGLFIQSNTGAIFSTKTMIISGNICRNNLINQIIIEANGSRVNNVAVFRDNIQDGTGAFHRPTWQNNRRTMFGTGVPISGDGTFEQGDNIFNIAPDIGSTVGWVCVTGGAPGTWATFGTVDLQGSATWDPGSLADGAGETKQITVTGASLGDFVLVSAPYDLQDMTATGYVQAADTVEIRLQNESGGTIDLASGTWKVKVIKV